MKELLKAKSEFRKIGVKLTADKSKSGGGGSWKFAGEDNLIKTIQEPLTKCGLEVIAKMDYDTALGVNIVCVSLYHVDSGEVEHSKISLSEVEPKSDRNGNKMYLDAEIEKGKQFGYWSRILTIRILGLSDIDPEDIDNVPQDLTDEFKNDLEGLKLLIKDSSDPDATEKWIKSSQKISSIDRLTHDKVKEITRLIEQKKKSS